TQQMSLDSLLPVSVIVQEITVIPGVEHGLEKQSKHLHAANAAKTPVGGVDASANNAEPPVCNFLAQQIIFREQCALVKSAQPLEHFTIEQHEHSGAEWTNHQRAILGDVVAQIQNTVTQSTLRAPDIGGHTVQSAAFHQLQR